jgi:hypothetical protein
MRLSLSASSPELGPLFNAVVLSWPVGAGRHATLFVLKFPLSCHNLAAVSPGGFFCAPAAGIFANLSVLQKYPYFLLRIMVNHPIAQAEHRLF